MDACDEHRPFSLSGGIANESTSSLQPTTDSGFHKVHFRYHTVTHHPNNVAHSRSPYHGLEAVLTLCWSASFEPVIDAMAG
jgi:hypothetical protein